MKNKFIMFFTYSLFFSVNGYCQFNTVLQKKDIPKAEPVLATTENKLIEEKEKAVVVNDALTTERLAYWKQRRYLSLPIDSMVITSHYGKRKDPFTGKIANHRGIDLKGNNDYVYSIMPGMVVKTGKNKGLGNYVEVRHGDFTSIYGHLYSVLVNAKQAVEAGQPIGISGSTGRSTGEHLHFQMEYKDKTIDPKPILDYINEVIRTVKGQISQQIDNELRLKYIEKEDWKSQSSLFGRIRRNLFLILFLVFELFLVKIEVVTELLSFLFLLQDSLRIQ